MFALISGFNQLELFFVVFSVLLGILAEPSIGDLVAPALDRLQMPSGVTETVGWLLALGTAAVLQMLLGELVPKNVAIAEPERTLCRLAPVHNVVVVVLRPAIWVLDRLAGLAVRPFGYTPAGDRGGQDKAGAQSGKDGGGH